MRGREQQGQAHRCPGACWELGVLREERHQAGLRHPLPHLWGMTGTTCSGQHCGSREMSCRIVGEASEVWPVSGWRAEVAWRKWKGLVSACSCWSVWVGDLRL